MTAISGATLRAGAPIWCSKQRKSSCAPRSTGRVRPGSTRPISTPTWRRRCSPSYSTCTSGSGATTGSSRSCRRIRFAPDPESYAQTVAGLERDGLPVVDHIRGTLPVAAEAVEPGYRKLIEELPLGVTHFALHCTAPGDVRAITPQHDLCSIYPWPSCFCRESASTTSPLGDCDAPHCTGTVAE
jgi:hypothetical protein